MREFTEDMIEISGFGGEYEETCRNMVLAGLDWFDVNPDTDPQFKGYEGVYGILLDDNEDAKSLTKAVIAGAGEYGPTGAMHQASTWHVMKAHTDGWESYCEQSREQRVIAEKEDSE